MLEMYPIRRPARSTHIPIRQHRYHVLRWGDDFVAGRPADPARPPLVLMHGWMDVAASFQFVVDAFSDDFLRGRTLLAADWRGFGLTEGPAQDNFWFPDYMADLDFLLDACFGDQPVDLLGHSMGGNVVTLYAGVRPTRIRRLVNLEGFGMPASQPEQAPSRYARWIDELKALHRGEMALRGYPDAEGVARRLMKTNPRLSPDKADWLARQWARPNAQGEWEILGEAGHKIVNAQIYRVDEVLASYARITAPTLVVEASDNQMAQWWQGRYKLDEFHQRITHIPTLRQEHIEDAGHMLHHDQPERLAALLEDFLD